MPSAGCGWWPGCRTTPDRYPTSAGRGCSRPCWRDGRVFLYDVGANAGPNVTRREIAPYLWSRRIRRIDEVFVSHADLDHFNGLPALLDRFAVGQVTVTPT